MKAAISSRPGDVPTIASRKIPKKSWKSSLETCRQRGILTLAFIQFDIQSFGKSNLLDCLLPDNLLQTYAFRDEIESVLARKEELEKQLGNLLAERDTLTGSLELSSTSIIQLEKKHREQELIIRYITQTGSSQFCWSTASNKEYFKFFPSL